MKNPNAKAPKAPVRPVSEKFYDEIIHRVAVTVCCNLDQPQPLIQRMKILVNVYLERGEKPVKTENIYIRLMFSLIQPEIDKAMARSKRARESAARRREAREAMKNAEATNNDAEETKTEAAAKAEETLLGDKLLAVPAVGQRGLEQGSERGIDLLVEESRKIIGQSEHGTRRFDAI